ncbi:hypothetical protein C8R42DRAFT_728503 [Lentinula raphanica]|nr:hypothetical protein C8R42DRAFT_728503 [Lentinula raphanica]
MSFQLDTGICQQINSPTFNDDELRDRSLTLQVVSLKKVGKHQEDTHLPSDRYRIVLSDGAHLLQAVLATQLNDMVVEGNLKKYTVVCVERLSCSYMQGRRLVIVVRLRILGQENEKIGEPVLVETNANSEAPTPAVETPLRRQPSAQSTSITNIPALSVCPPPRGATGFLSRVLVLIKTIGRSKQELLKSQNSNRIRMPAGQATAFNAIADNLYPKLEEGKVYYVSKGKVNLAKKKFSNVQNDFEITLEAKSEIEECLETSNLPMIKYSFVTLQELQKLPKDSTCDVIAILNNYGDVSEITSRATSRTMKKRELTLVDQSGFSTRLTLWGNQAENFSPDEQSPVIAFKGSKSAIMEVRRSLGMVASATMTQNPDIPESHALRGWYDSAGSKSTFQSYSVANGLFTGSSGAGFNRSAIKSLLEMELEANRIPDSDEKPVYFLY